MLHPSLLLGAACSIAHSFPKANTEKHARKYQKSIKKGWRIPHHPFIKYYFFT